MWFENDSKKLFSAARNSDVSVVRTLLLKGTRVSPELTGTGLLIDVLIEYWFARTLPCNPFYPSLFDRHFDRSALWQESTKLNDKRVAIIELFVIHHGERSFGKAIRDPNAIWRIWKSGKVPKSIFAQNDRAFVDMIRQQEWALKMARKSLVKMTTLPHDLINLIIELV